MVKVVKVFDIFNVLLTETMLGSIPEAILQVWYAQFILETGVDWLTVVTMFSTFIVLLFDTSRGCLKLSKHRARAIVKEDTKTFIEASSEFHDYSYVRLTSTVTATELHESLLTETIS